ncbi:hypothetical protein [Novosphingobium mangrovi (ex Huang et al. 2023)]|uniref:Uncharacterized protein n=1 Tax=Novosphingobium mangrovi (ex Huang et al. 2023) TaxID=2976432 RepID=A0ABT2I161_9SPHN|nr:hypothetical protein [Novosphingobium mangrovi (ex Huang et al. 2023)]MCT2398529.1 hypothetical protein [Novosphingobium mangrovi (ex Huang et al. 2023)]
MTTSREDLHPCPIGGVTWWLRTPTVFDPARMRRVLTRQGVRRPTLTEMRVASLAGIAAIAEAVGDTAEGERQSALLEEWYEIIVPIDEDDVDDPDPVSRSAELERRRAEQLDRQRALMADVIAIEANLERHHPPYRELVADRQYWDEVSQIEVVRMLLLRKDDELLARDPDGMLTQATYASIPEGHRGLLAKFAMALLAPDKATEKN